jgi:hypothetical protein
MELPEFPLWQAVILFAAGFIGWRIKAAGESVTLQSLKDEQAMLRDRIRSLENGNVANATAQATLAAQIEAPVIAAAENLARGGAKQAVAAVAAGSVVA